MIEIPNIFNASTKSRLARNRILSIEDNYGNFHHGDSDIGKIAEGYFQELFTTTRDDHVNYQSVFEGFQPRVTSEINDDLVRAVSDEEIQTTIFAIGEDKAPGPDGLTGAFYQQFWPDIKGAVTQEIRDFFNTGEMGEETNHANICLIPKPEIPTSMSDFKSIALCNVSYKIMISKILVSRLKHHLSGIVTENQTAFIPGCNIMDKVIMAHEMLHSLKSRKRWARSYMAVKTDISKAYDCLEWSFLQDTMVHMGFNIKWINWIMKCVSSVTFSVLVNGSTHRFIKPSRGIRQGDPLSPYLFILCSEVLSHLLTNVTSVNKLKGMKISNTGPTINHLLFADDALFFCHAHPKSCSTIMEILTRYETVSGQAVNLHKSAITFGSRVKQQVKTQLRRILNIHNDGGGGKYLGLPEQIGGKKKEIFSYIVNRVQQKTKGWSNRFLSDAGKEILIKTVALSLPVYTMHCFKLPKGICDDINSLLARYWWSKSPYKKSMHWLAWKRLTIPKNEGGLGFRDITSFNKAMLAKQAWRILQSPTSLLSRLLRGKYFETTNILNAGTGRKPSFIWRSILEGRDLLKQGIRILIGDGNQTNIWTDPWLPTHPSRPPQKRDDAITNLTRVQQLIQDGTNMWNKEIIEDTFVEEDARLIQRLRLRSRPSPDLLGWNYTKHGEYTVKSGYWLCTHLPDQVQDFVPPPGLIEFKKAIWKLNTAPKLRHFLWRIITHSLATDENLERRHITSDSQCKRCCAAAETLDHLFFGCHYAQAIWRGSPVSNSDFFNANLSFDDKFRLILQCCNNERLDNITRQIPLWMLWRIWKSRNLLVYQRRWSFWQDDVQKAITDSYEWLPSLRETQTQNDRRRNTQGWNKPAQGFIKCNYDCSYYNADTEPNAGWILRDDTGGYITAAESKGQPCNSALEAELQALLMAMQHAWLRGVKDAIFEGDNKIVATLINGTTKRFELHNLVMEIQEWRKKFTSALMQWSIRTSNKAADRLAKAHYNVNISYVSHPYVPTYPVQTLHEDYTSSL